MDVSTVYKKCNACLESKHKTLFGSVKKSPGKFTAKCKSCLREYNRKWRENNRERCRETRRNYWATDRGKDKQLRGLYGIGIAEFNQMHEAQGGVCKVCRQPEYRAARHGNGPRKLCIDHCHATGKVRGLLCCDCNTAAGMLKDDPERMINLAKYIAEHKE